MKTLLHQQWKLETFESHSQGETPQVKGVGMLVGNFELNP